ncbi:MAG TPA: ABC transporter permease subunit [Gemmataceae bacterium]|jgi:ABC-type transport system involved in multi-copper enzyme maturation permease subunit|nr:ABC transporter permease subunit [Gemmataceae bacterium]
MKFESTPLGFDNWRRLAWLAIEWVEDAGGFAMVGLVIWIIIGLIYPVNDTLPDGKKRNRLVGPGMLLSAAAALTAYLVALGLTYVVAGEQPGVKTIQVLGREGSVMVVFLEAALTVAGLIALIGFGGPFVSDCFRLRWRRIYAIAKLSFKEAVRRRIVWVFLVILILYLFPARWFFQEKPEDELKSIIGVTTRGMNVLLVSVGLLLAAFSIPSDIKNLTIHTIVTKPVERFEIILGRFLGYLGLITGALVIMTGFGLMLINAGNVSEEAAGESMRSRVARYGDLDFKSLKASDFKGMDVGKENGYRRYIVGRSSQRAVWSFSSIPDRFGTENSVPLEFAFDVYRTTKGTEGIGVQVTFEVVSHTWDPDKRIDDPANPGAQIRMEDAFNRDLQAQKLQNVNVTPEDAKNWAKVDALAEQYGRYVFNNWQVFDYHTSSLPIPGGIFRNANKGTPTRDSAIKVDAKQAPPRVQVRVRCESPSQFIGAARYDLYFLESEGSFSFNYFKGAAGLWFRLVIALVLSIACSTYLAGVLSFLTALMLFIAGFFLDFIQELASGTNVGGGPLESLARLIKNDTATAELDPNPVVRVLQGGDAAYRWLLRRVMNVIPDVDRYGLSDYVAQGFSIGPDFLLINFITLAAYTLPWFVAAYYLMKAREIAA